MLDSAESQDIIAVPGQLSSVVEQRFRKTKSSVSGSRNSEKQAAPESNGLVTGTSSESLCAPTDDLDEYTGRQLRPLWDLAVRTDNLVLRRLVLRHEIEVEGVLIAGRRSA